MTLSPGDGAFVELVKGQTYRRTKAGISWEADNAVGGVGHGSLGWRKCFFMGLGNSKLGLPWWEC